ncbi:hypothetical protein NPIL_352291 [Nephila pilipes]|uniref:Uncharacterized protein n=1 Tax=Nephila pilipes TaxID=299642 RepID=A0A8X6QJK2_NEPPI|nr:hypothetical protein NPIL_352291 [Nephila pilipes]
MSVRFQFNSSSTHRIQSVLVFCTQNGKLDQLQKRANYTCLRWTVYCEYGFGRRQRTTFVGCQASRWISVRNCQQSVLAQHSISQQYT